MTNSEIDYSLHYRRWNSTSPQFYDQQSSFFSRFLSDELSRFSRNSKVLDYGCGYGLLTYYLVGKFDDVIGVDASKQQIEVGLTHNLPLLHLPIDHFSLWCNDNKSCFDLIFLFDVLEHIKPDEQILFMRTLVLLLKPGGSIYIKVPNANSLLASRWRYIDWTHLSSFTEASLDFVCINSNLINPKYLPDDSSLLPRFLWIPRPSILRVYLKLILRQLWKIYLWSELGKQIKEISVGYNLFAVYNKIV